jgi:hypothetical protein
MLKGLLEELVKRPPRRVWQRPPDIFAQDTFLNELVKTRVCESMRHASHFRMVFTHLRASIIAPKGRSREPPLQGKAEKVDYKLGFGL